MRILAAVGLLAGLALAVALVAVHGAGDVWRAAASLGWSGFCLLITLRLLMVGGMGLAWWTLGRGRPDARPWRFAWGRLLRDAAGDTLPLSQLGGYVVGARAATLAGVSGRFAAGSTVVDVTVELAAQLAYILLGLGILASQRPGAALVWPALGAVAAMAVLITLFVALQARAGGAVERISRRLTGAWLGARAEALDDVQLIISGLYRRPGRCLAAGVLHGGCWLLSGVDTWLTLRLIGVARGLDASIAIDGLLYGLRSLAFLIPNALGVQEAGFILFGGLFGVSPDAALAVSLIRRARDLLVNVPALLAWQGMEGRRALRRRGRKLSA